MAILLIFTVLIGGGVAVGAEKSLPGDILYPVKVGFSEEVRGWAAISEESKADWEVERVQRRLEEAEQLADNGSLSAEASNNIEANFEAHAQRVRDRVEKFRDKENFNAAASLSLNFESALKAHDRILSKLAQKKGDVEVQLKPIRTKIRSEFRESAQGRKQMNVELRGGVDGSVRAGDDDKEDDSHDTDSTDTEEDLELDSSLEIELEL